MEMESSRRSMDRSRELGIKKARIGEDAERDRGFNRVAERERSLDRPAQRGSPLLERFRAIEREREGDRERGRGRAGGDEETVDRENDREDSVQGGQQQQQHELVNQYKNALGELTFNSKPIITNLTIIAGENSHAAKVIAATVCAHILEVPNEQKLPSLYLLDSIVKNIGGDYVKYFAGRLPEVFCKAYRQVDPATHPGMQHLFRTWRGVFPPVPLRIIEEELQFPPSVNGSSSGTTTPRSSDSQSQRPGHSIHVNPKYLEARQRLQQSSRAEGTNSENNEDEPTQETERSERTMRESPKGWSEAPPLKRSNAPRPPRGDAFSEPGYGQKPAAGYADYDLGSDRVRPSEMGMGRPNNRVVERDNGLERPWYGEGLGELESSTSSVTYGQRNGYEWQQPPARGPLVDAYGNYRVPGSVRGPLPHLMPPQDIASRNSRVMSRNWQNSEEEEYMWEDMSTRLVDHGRGSDKSRKDDWFPGDMEKPLGSARGKRMGPEPDLPNSNWRSLGPLSQMDQPMGDEERIPLRRELDDHLPSSLMQHDVGARSGRETSVEMTSILRTTQTALGHRSLPGWLSHQHLNLPPQSRPRTLPTDPSNHASLVSLNVGQSEGKAVTSLNGGLSTNIVPPSGLRTNFRTNIGLPPSTGPLNFGSLPPVTPVSSGMSSRQRQSQRPPSPSSQPSIQQLPCSSPSALPRQQPVQLVQHQQQRNFIKPDYLQVQAFPSHPSQLVQQVPQPPPQMQQVPQPQPASDSLHQLPHNHAQSGHSLQLLHMPQQIQSLQHFQNPPSSAAPSQQGHQMQFSQQLQPEPPQQIQPVSLSHQTYSQSLMQTHPLQQVELRSLPQLPPPSFGPPQTMGHASSGISTNPSPPLQGQTSTQNLLAAIFQSGLFPANSGQVASNPQPASPKGYSDFGSSQPLMHIQPPLPSGPPPVQFSTSTAISSALLPVVSLPVPTPVPSLSGPIPGSTLAPPPPNNLSMLPSQPMRMVQPPLPPGPPPASSLVGATSQSTSSVATQPSSVNPLSNLLNSLVAKGLISASSESATSSLSLSATPSVPNQLPGHSAGFAASNPGQAAVSVPFSGAAVLSTSTAVLPIPASTVLPPEKIPAEAQVVKDPIGVEFKQETIRERHASVINVLYDDFPRQCRTCGLRLKFQEEHSKHMDWHASRNHEQKLQKKASSRKWFPSMKGWLGGNGVSSSEVSPFFVKDKSLQTEDNEHSAVPADENQSVCALCGEPFEDFYSDVTEEWMYKGAVYMNAPPGGTIGNLDSSLLGPIVHVKCRSESTAVSLEDSEEDDVDEEDGLGCRRKTIWY